MSMCVYHFKVVGTTFKLVNYNILQTELGKFSCLLYSQNVIQYLGTSRNVNFFSYQTSLCIFPSCLSLFSFLCLNLKRDHDVLIQPLDSMDGGACQNWDYRRRRNRYSRSNGSEEIIDGSIKNLIPKYFFPPRIVNSQQYVLCIIQIRHNYFLC